MEKLCAGCAGRNTVKTNGSSIATGEFDDDGGEQLLWVPGMQDTHPALVSGPGARVVVHSQETLPHPTADGFDVPAEFSVTIGVSARENVRVSQPHGNCTRDDRPPAASVDHTSRLNYRSVPTRSIADSILISITHALETGAINRLHFSGAGFMSCISGTGFVWCQIPAPIRTLFYSKPENGVHVTEVMVGR